MYIFKESDDVVLSDFQFGFIKSRGTNTAISLLNDVATYCTSNGSQLYTCSPDAEGSFDAIPHPVLFGKTMNIISDMSWRLLYVWYEKITVKIKWAGFSERIAIGKGTRQGELTSPLLFNIFYRDLSVHEGGVTIDNHKFIYCYADDILLASTTVTGSQNMINTAVNYISEHGLCFNPVKTNCLIKGKHPFINDPKWYINRKELKIEQHVKYIGAVISNNSGKEHVSFRLGLNSCRKYFYSLQGAGLSHNSQDIDTLMYIWSSTCNSVLLYGCESMYISKQNIKELDKLQSELIKCLMGIGSSYKTTPLLNALKIYNISEVTNLNSWFCLKI